ncbi:MAG: 3-isopropylmalate dehydratase small subunit [Bacillota bacterium]|jgi:3-isopropylmalate/(R)-2-methylmalate dehydratase small subunit|nr:3-isopropylmalate dehydratase small subunit [Bacillota bacterium]HOB91284.1 3-isopropylmalate dehydratase small subunit [Bacillota bacterium]HPZ53689.1 3-isopropylmalate dehydratase small subunit [Bacillota bacterium]HQD17950.1 3-isopropylmalate dehydratase small subunit [Bacillota bacterium]
MKAVGRACLFGDNIDTDAIIPARYLNTSDPEELAAHCMEDADPNFVSNMSKGDLIIAGSNFGCGSSREHAPIAIKAAGVSCVIAKSFARIFFRNSINIGLPIFECPEAVEEAENGDEFEVDMSEGKIVNLSKGKEYRSQPLSEEIQEIIADGGLVGHVRKRVMAGG